MQQVLTLLTVFSDVCESGLLLIHICNLLRDCDDHYVQGLCIHFYRPDADPLDGDPPKNAMQRLPLPRDTWDTVNKRAIRILLECILVAIAIAITTHPIEKYRNGNNVINRRCEWTSKDNWSVKSLAYRVCCSTK